MLTLAHHGVAIRPVCPVRTRIWSVGFCRGRKTGKSGEKTSEQEREPSTNSTHMTPGLGFEYGPHWWEASAWNSRSGGLSLPRDSLVFFFRGGGGELASRSELSAVWGGSLDLARENAYENPCDREHVRHVDFLFFHPSRQLDRLASLLRG